MNNLRNMKLTLSSIGLSNAFIWDNEIHHIHDALRHMHFGDAYAKDPSGDNILGNRYMPVGDCEFLIEDILNSQFLARPPYSPLIDVVYLLHLMHYERPAAANALNMLADSCERYFSDAVDYQPFPPHWAMYKSNTPAYRAAMAVYRARLTATSGLGGEEWCNARDEMNSKLIDELLIILESCKDE